MSAESAPEGTPGRARWLGLVVFLAALLPALGTLRAPWISEDATVLAHLAEESPWADWTRPWFGMEILRFWRPWVSTSFGAQFAWTGIEPVPLRLLNLALHAGAAWLAWRCVRQLGGGPLDALACGLFAGWFPAQGGTVTWLSGRTDLWSGFLLVACVSASLGARPWLAALCAFLAAASKEFGFLAPLWSFLFLWARDGNGRAAARGAAPVLAAALGAFLWRGLALGTFAGGYAGGIPLTLAAFWKSAEALLLGPREFVAVLLCAGFLRPVLGRDPGARRGALAALLAALSALVLLVQLLADGHLERENERLLFVPWLALFLVPLSSARAPRGATLVARACSVLLLSWFAVEAWRDAQRWSSAAESGERAVAEARAAVRELTPGPAPVLFRSFPMSADGAYVLQFGVADRFRVPFPAAPRPVWPWRLLFVADPAREREPLLAPRADGAIRPLDDLAAVPPLVLSSRGAPVATLALDESVLPQGEDRSLPLALADAPAGATLEFVLYTELGYEPFPAGAFDAEGRAHFTLRAALQLANGVTLAIQVLQQANDLGAQRAYLEFRALGPDGAAIAASSWIELTWSAELARR